MSEFSDGSEEVRKQWVEKITDHIWGSQSNNSLGVIRPWDFILAPMAPLSPFPFHKLNERVTACLQLLIASRSPVLTPWDGRNKPTVKNALHSRLYITKSVLERSLFNGLAMRKCSSVTAMPSSQTMSKPSHLLSSLPFCHFGASTLLK